MAKKNKVAKAPKPLTEEQIIKNLITTSLNEKGELYAHVDPVASDTLVLNKTKERCVEDVEMINIHDANDSSTWPKGYAIVLKVDRVVRLDPQEPKEVKVSIKV